MKRLIYTICLLVACLSTAGAKVLTEHKTRLTDNWLYLRGESGNFGKCTFMDTRHIATLLQRDRCSRPGLELLSRSRMV